MKKTAKNAMTLKDVAIHILYNNGNKPMKSADIIKAAEKEGIYERTAATPEKTLASKAKYHWQDIMSSAKGGFITLKPGVKPGQSNESPKSSAKKKSPRKNPKSATKKIPNNEKFEKDLSEVRSWASVLTEISDHDWDCKIYENSEGFIEFTNSDGTLIRADMFKVSELENPVKIIQAVNKAIHKDAPENSAELISDIRTRMDSLNKYIQKELDQRCNA